MTVELSFSQSPTVLASRLRSRPPEPVTENSLLKGWSSPIRTMAYIRGALSSGVQR